MRPGYVYKLPFSRLVHTTRYAVCMKQRRMVELSDLNRWIPKQSRGHKVYGYTYLDLADLYGVKVDTVRHWVTAGKLNPCNIKSIIELYVSRG